MTFPKDVAKARAAERTGSIEERQVQALELIADALECIRVELLAANHSRSLQARGSGINPR